MALVNMANVAAMGVAYEEIWSADFSRSEVKSAWFRTSLHDRNQGFTVEQLRSLDDETLLSLGFMKWDEHNGLRLIPLWACNYIADGETLVSINGNSSIKGLDDIDLDIRFGCIAFGFKKN